MTVPVLVLFSSEFSVMPGSQCDEQNDNILRELNRLDICGYSILHHFFTRPPVQKTTFLKSYFLPWLIAAFLFYGLPLFVALVVDSDVLFPDAAAGRAVGFLDDWNVMFAGLVSIPVLVVLVLSERSLVPRWIGTIMPRSETSRPEPEDVRRFVDSWNNRCKIVNLLGQLAGILVAAAVASANCKAARSPGFNGWSVTEGEINAVGWMSICWQLAVSYWILTLYVSQVIATISLLASLSRRFKIHCVPFHHDNCCGLASVGRIGLRNQYLLAVVGMNLLALLAVNLKRDVPQGVPLLVAGAIAYVTLGPVVFIGPLLPFRKNMRDAKRSEQARVASRLQREYERIIRDLDGGPISKEDEEVIDRLQKLRTMVNQIPVWPFDTGTLRRFFVAYVLPFLTALVPILISHLTRAIGNMLE